MNSRQQQAYARGLEMVKRDALTVVAHGTLKSTGAAVYAVPSRSEANRWHLVTVHGLALTCDCHAAHYNRYCAHRAAVRCRLEIEAAVRRDTRERAIEQAFHAAARELDMTIDAQAARTAKREAAPLARSTWNGSLFK
jgi:hypothetical protein